MMAAGALRQAWSRLAERERRLVALALAVVLAGLLWSLGMAPALGILRTAPARLAELDRQLQSMQSLQAAGPGIARTGRRSVATTRCVPWRHRCNSAWLAGRSSAATATA